MAKKYQFIDINGMKKFLAKIHERYSPREDVDKKIATSNEKILAVEEKITVANGKIDNVDRKFETVNEKVSSVEGNILTINSNISELKNQETVTPDKITLIESRIQELTTKIANVNTESPSPNDSSKIEELISDINALKNDAKLTATEKSALQNAKASDSNKFATFEDVEEKVNTAISGIDFPTELTEDQKKALDVSSANEGNKFVTREELENYKSTDSPMDPNILAALNNSAASETNIFITSREAIYTAHDKVNELVPEDIQNAFKAAENPNSENPFITKSALVDSQNSFSHLKVITTQQASALNNPSANDSNPFISKSEVDELIDVYDKKVFSAELKGALNNTQANASNKFITNNEVNQKLSEVTRLPANVTAALNIPDSSDSNKFITQSILKKETDGIKNSLALPPNVRDALRESNASPTTNKFITASQLPAAIDSNFVNSAKQNIVAPLLFLSNSNFIVPITGIYEVTLVGGGGGGGGGGRKPNHGLAGGTSTFICGAINYSANGGAGGSVYKGHDKDGEHGNNTNMIVDNIEKPVPASGNAEAGTHGGEIGKGFGAGGGGGGSGNVPSSSNHYGRAGGRGDIMTKLVYLRAKSSVRVIPGAGGKGGTDTYTGHGFGGNGGDGMQGFVKISLYAAT